MGHVRKRPTLLEKKLLAIREFLNATQVDMASKLEIEILYYSSRHYPIKPGRTSEYENGRREPNLFVLMGYGRLAKVHLESLVDDEVTLRTFQLRLGKEIDYSKLSRRRKNKSIDATHAGRRKMQKTINALDTPPTTALLHRLMRVPINFDIQSVVAPPMRPRLVCRYCKTAICAAVCQYCKTPLYAVDGRVCYLHTNSGIATCESPQVEGLPNRATPDEDNATYVAYRAELITEMTS